LKGLAKTRIAIGAFRRAADFRRLQTAKSNSHVLRSSNGFYLVEMLVALTIGIALTGALLNMLGETLRLTTTSRIMQLSSAYSHNVLDAVKNGFTGSMPSSTYPLVVDSQTPGQSYAGPVPMPIGLNMGDYVWSSKSVSNKLHCSAYYTVEAGIAPGTTSAVVVFETTGGTQLSTKTKATLTTLHQRGINFWQ